MLRVVLGVLARCSGGAPATVRTARGARQYRLWCSVTVSRAVARSTARGGASAGAHPPPGGAVIPACLRPQGDVVSSRLNRY